MLQQLFFAAIIMTPFAFLEAPSDAQKPAQIDETDRSRPGKAEIMDWMVRVSAMPPEQRDERIDRICRAQSDAGTPRSDFLFCIGLAYCGSCRAQACVGKAYESGRGIIEDLMEAHAWYDTALQNPDIDKSEASRIQADQDRVKSILISVYPAPSDFELQESAAFLKNQILHYQQEIKKRGD